MDGRLILSLKSPARRGNMGRKGERNMLPKDPMMLLSYVNTKLRDDYPSLDALCEELDLDRASLEATLAAVGFSYVEEQNRFA